MIREARRLVRRALFLSVDLALVGLALTCLAVMLTGGGVLWIHGHSVSLLRARNPLLFLLALLPLRLWLGRDVALLLSTALPVSRVVAASASACLRLSAGLAGLTPAGAQRGLAVMILLSALLKLGSAWYYDGFANGDAIEIHRMTFSVLRGTDLGVWELRSPFYPMIFVFPLQKVVWLAGLHDPRVLIFAGRLVVIGFSLLNVWLVFEVGRRYRGSLAVGLVAAYLLAISRLHIRLGSSELPRTVASSFLLLCFLILVTRRGTRPALAAGAALGLGASLRFGEAVFILPFIGHLAEERRIRELALGLVSAGITLALVLGPGDLLYWPEMFHSLRHMLDYSVVQGLSSSGYQPAWEYLRIAPAASDIFTLGLVVYGLWLRPGKFAGWAVLPVLLLSFFQRKDERYLLPVLPFALLCAAIALWSLLAAASRSRSAWRQAFVIYLLAGATLLELEGFRRRGSEGAMAVARWLAARPDLRDVAMQDATTVTGADLYLAGHASLLNIDSERVGEGAYFYSFLSRREAQYVALPEESLRSYGYAEWMRSAGFERVDIGAAARDWLLYRRRAGPEAR